MTRFFFSEGQNICNTKRLSWMVLLSCTIIVVVQIYTKLAKTTAGKKSNPKSQSGIGVSLLPFLISDNSKGRVNSKQRRAVIHSYYSSVDLKKALQNNANLRTWAEMWSDVGWDPVLLSLNDARRHPDFAAHVAEGMDISHNVRYTRYLAMSAVPGGGWYTEIHVFPLHPIQPSEKLLGLPHKGKFTGHDRHVPSLLSGSQREWTRLAHALINHPIEEDMLALHDLHIQDATSYFYEDSVISYRVLAKNPTHLEIPKLCEVTNDKRAIRISPEDIQDLDGASRTLKEKNQSYYAVTRAFMSKWRSACVLERPII